MSIKSWFGFAPKSPLESSPVPSAATEGSLPFCEATLGWTFACSRSGAYHVRSNAPCQDAFAMGSFSVAGKPCLIAAVADGHGDKRHDLSHFGASLAVKAAVDELLSFHCNFVLETSPVSLSSTFKADFPRRVSRRWSEAVLEDASTRLAVAPRDDSGIQDVLKRYGTTLLAALIVSHSIFVAQIGDGDILFLKHDGEIESPFQKNPNLIGTEVYSLCSTDAHKLWQTSALDRTNAELILMTTDGLSDSLEEAGLHAFVRIIRDRLLCFGPEKLSASIPFWLDSYSESGSGDDMTLALVSMRQHPALQTAEIGTTDAQIRGESDPERETKDAVTNRGTGPSGNTEGKSAGKEKAG